MKDLNMLVWLTQLGMSIAVPLGGFVWGAMWLRERFGLGKWVIVCGCIVGLICAVDSTIRTFKMLGAVMSRQQKKKEEQLKVPPVSFNEHD